MADVLIRFVEDKSSMSECLNKAADLIEEKGWGKEGYYLGTASEGTAYNFCMIGACLAVCPKETAHAFALALGFFDASEAFQWNDTRRSCVTVIKRLRFYANGGKPPG